MARTDGLPGRLMGGVDGVKGGSLTEFDWADVEGPQWMVLWEFQRRVKVCRGDIIIGVDNYRQGLVSLGSSSLGRSLLGGSS